MEAGSIRRIPLRQNVAPSACQSNLTEVFTHLQVIWMQARILDRELPHVGQTSVSPVELLREPVVLANYFALFMQRWRFRQQSASSERTYLTEDPRVADRTASHGHAINA